jgi:hypothetical protein
MCKCDMLTDRSGVSEEDRHLEDVDRVDEGVPHLDEVPQHMVVLQQLVVSCHLARSPTNTQCITNQHLSSQFS